MQIPTRFLAECELCHGKRGGPIDTRLEGAMQWTAGWCMVRNGGGAHGVSLPQRDPTRWAHRQCVDLESKGLGGQRSFAV